MPHEETLVETTLNNLLVGEVPEKLIGDEAYDSDKLNARPEQGRGIELIAPHQSNRKKPKTQDGRKLRHLTTAGEPSDCSPGAKLPSFGRPL